MRPKKTRWIKCSPGERCFRPRCVPARKMQGVTLSLDEFEVIRLCDLEGREQEVVAKMMKVHRSTISRILSSARLKIADALVHIKAIRIEGGCCEVIGRKGKKHNA